MTPVDKFAVKQKPESVPRNSGTTLFSGGGEMEDRIRSLIWSETVLWPMETWPDALKTAVRICLGALSRPHLGLNPLRNGGDVFLHIAGVIASERQSFEPSGRRKRWLEEEIKYVNGIDVSPPATLVDRC